jgi:hypothetical protein
LPKEGSGDAISSQTVNPVKRYEISIKEEAGKKKKNTNYPIGNERGKISS